MKIFTADIFIDTNKIKPLKYADNYKIYYKF